MADYLHVYIIEPKAPSKRHKYKGLPQNIRGEHPFWNSSAIEVIAVYRIEMLVLLFIWTYSPSPAAAQSQTTMVDFEGLPASTGGCTYGYQPPDQPRTLAPPLQTAWATISGGELQDHTSSTTNDHSIVYQSGYLCAGDGPTITVNFRQPVSNITFFAGTRNGFGALVVRDDKGDELIMDTSLDGWPEYLVYPSWSGIKQLTIFFSRSSTTVDPALDAWGNFYADNFSFRLVSDMTFLDPVAELLSGNNIVSDPETLATIGTPVSAIAADGASRVVLRLKANRAGERLTLTVLNDQGTPSTSTQEDGGVTTIQNAGAVQTQMQLTAVNTSLGAMAFALYRPPPDFSRDGKDDSAADRIASLKVESLDYPGATSTTPITILRPPVVLVHGMWGDTSDWNTFTPLINDPRFFVDRAGYSHSPAGVVSASVPSYLGPLLSMAKTSALGFAYNAQEVLTDIELAISEFCRLKNAAAVQADVVARSMGGTIARTLENLPEYTAHDSFGSGKVHKLITIGTPHLGSPIATNFLEDDNACIRRLFAVGGRLAFESVTLAGVQVSGAVADLRGDGWGGSLSPALTVLQTNNDHPVPTAMIAGEMNPDNLSGLDCLVCKSFVPRHVCPGNPLSDALTPQAWPALFGQPSDAIVPRASQLANASGREIAGVIHSSGLTALGFSRPSELEERSTIPALVVDLLNESILGADFHPLP